MIKIFNSVEPKYGVVKLRKDEAKVIYPKTNSIKRLLKWKPKTSFDVGLTKQLIIINQLNNENFSFNNI